MKDGRNCPLLFAYFLSLNPVALGPGVGCGGGEGHGGSSHRLRAR